MRSIERSMPWCRATATKHCNTVSSAEPSIALTDATVIFPAARENTGKNPVGAQKRRNSSQIDPCNQSLTSFFPVRLAGKRFPCQVCRQGNGRENSHLRPGSDPVTGENGLWIIRLHIYLVL